MLRHIVSFSLAITAGAILMPSKAMAATLTVIPLGEIQKNRGDVIEFIFAFTPPPPREGVSIQFSSLTYKWDGSELSLRTSAVINENTVITNTTTVGRILFDVFNPPVKDGKSDLFDAQVNYKEVRLFTPSVSDKTPIVSGADVVPVPEPLTMFGAGAALGYGAIVKRKYSKKTES
jgi:hypothetical protein